MPFVSVSEHDIAKIRKVRSRWRGTLTYPPRVEVRTSKYLLTSGRCRCSSYCTPEGVPYEYLLFVQIVCTKPMMINLITVTGIHNIISFRNIIHFSNLSGRVHITGGVHILVIFEANILKKSPAYYLYVVPAMENALIQYIK